MENLLEIKDLRVDFLMDKQPFTAVDGVRLEVERGETTVLAGESGSGKTVTALSITQLLPPRARVISGSVLFNGLDLLTLDEQAINKFRGRDISYVFQEPVSYLNPVYTIGNQITEVIRLHQGKSCHEAGKEAMEFLSLVKIKEAKRIFNSYPHQLSGGMNQRAFIAMSLACKPKLLIADEPTTSLDVVTESHILELPVELKKEIGFSLLFITHNLSIAARIADRIVIMCGGRVVEEGSVSDIFSSAKHLHAKELIRAYEKIGKI